VARSAGVVACLIYYGNDYIHNTHLRGWLALRGQVPKD
jgi:hypothetical protein